MNNSLDTNAQRGIVDYTEEVEMLQGVPASPMWICDSTLCVILGFTFGSDEDSKLPECGRFYPDREALTLFIKKLRQGKASVGGSKLGMVDIFQTAPNKLLLHYQKYGKGMFWNRNGECVLNNQRWFCRYDVSKSSLVYTIFPSQNRPHSFVSILFNLEHPKSEGNVTLSSTNNIGTCTSWG